MMFEYDGLRLNDDLVVNIDDFVPSNQQAYFYTETYVLCHEFGPFAIVFAPRGDLQAALNIACDEGERKFWPFDPIENPSDQDYENYATVGNDCKLYDLTYLHVRQIGIHTPPMSYCALLKAHLEGKKPFTWESAE